MSDPGSPTWDGRGLPPVARQRLRRAKSASVATSLLSAPAAASLAAVGFQPVGEVMGAIVEHIGWRGLGCGLAWGSPIHTVTSGSGNRWAGLGPYVEAQYLGWDTALGRMLKEAAALGADGVVGVRLTRELLGAGGNHEFLAMGTAIRSRGRTHADRPFSTDLQGQDLAKLLRRGWAPAGIAVGVAAAVRHDSNLTWQQTNRWSTNEVSGYTDLVNRVRHEARTQFHRRAAGFGGQAAIVSEMTLHVWEAEPAENHRDHYADATMLGTAAVQFRRTPTDVTSSSILPLRDTPTKEQSR